MLALIYIDHHLFPALPPPLPPIFNRWKFHFPELVFSRWNASKLQKVNFSQSSMDRIKTRALNELDFAIRKNPVKGI